MLRGGYGFYYDAPSQDFFLAQSFPNGNVGTNPVPGLGTFTVNFTGPVPFGPGVDIFGGANHARAAVHRLRRGPAYADAVRPELQLQRAADPRRGHRAAGWLCRIERHEAVPRAGHQSGHARTGGDAAATPALQCRSTRSSPASINWKPPPTPTTTLCRLCLRRRLSKGLTLFASHVWSHSIDDASNGFCSCTAGVSLPQNSFDTRAEKAASSFDQRQRFTVNFVYDLDVLPRVLEQVAQAADRRLAVERHLHPGQRSSDHSLLERRGPQRKRRIEQRPAERRGQSERRTQAVGRLVQHRGFRRRAGREPLATPAATP